MASRTNRRSLIRRLERLGWEYQGFVTLKGQGRRTFLVFDLADRWPLIRVSVGLDGMIYQAHLPMTPQHNWKAAA